MKFSYNIISTDKNVVENFPGAAPLPSPSSSTTSSSPCNDSSCIYYIPFGAQVCQTIRFDQNQVLYGSHLLSGDSLNNPLYISSNLNTSLNITETLAITISGQNRCIQNLNTNGKTYLYNPPQPINIYVENKKPEDFDYKNQKEVLGATLPDSDGLFGNITKLGQGHDFEFKGPAPIKSVGLPSYSQTSFYKFKFSLGYLGDVLIYDNQNVLQETDVRYFYYNKGTKLSIKNLYIRKKKQIINFNNQSQNYLL